MIHNEGSFGNVIYTEIILHANEISDRNTFETNIYINQNTFETKVYINQNTFEINI